jgi:hypothetical protein
MRIASILAPVALALGAPALAQDTPAAAPVAAAAKFTLATPIEQIVADPVARAALESVLPGLSNHPSYDVFKAISLKDLAPYSEGKLTPELLTKAEAALATVR